MLTPALCFIHGGGSALGLLFVLALILLFAFAIGGRDERPSRRSRLMTRAQWEQSVEDGEGE
jgi:hypothetical protein